ncbi:MAG TPA: hypothetical protein VI933_02360 [archaeon]|nr:hypothetical protein [archaeon]
MPAGTEQERKPTQKRKGPEYDKAGGPPAPGVTFDAGKVFGPEAAKSEDFDLYADRDSATYRARHGQGGDRSRIYGTA